jgi:FkbM family methyltransferase
MTDSTPLPGGSSTPSIPDFVEVLSGTDDWLLRHDSYTRDAILRVGRLDWDDRIRNLPFLKSLTHDSIVVDAGAFIGDTTRIFSLLGAEVHAFEPRPDAYACLEHNADPRVHAYPYPLGSGETYGLPNYAQFDPRNLGGRPLSRIRCGPRTTPLDSLGLNRIDLFKIDTEGWEPLVLQGARRLIHQYKPAILIEINDDALKRQGFRSDDIFLQLPGYTWTSIGGWDWFGSTAG